MILNVTLEDTYKDSELEVGFGESTDCGCDCESEGEMTVVFGENADCGCDCESEGEMTVYFGEIQTITGSGTKDYNRLKNRPSINEHVLIGGENSLESIGIGLTSNQEISKLFK